MLRFPFVLLRNILSFLGFLWSTFWYNLEYLFRRKKTLYLSAELESDYEFGPPEGVARYVREGRSFLELRELLERISETPSIDGLVVECDEFEMGTARVQALTWMLDDIREGGTHVVAHLRMPTTSEYMLATAADDILIPPTGRLYTFGPRFDQFFGAHAVERLELFPQMIHIGDFKTAAHRLVHEEMTVPQEVMMNGLHDTLVEQLEERIEVRRPIGGEGGERLFELAPADSREALGHGLVDHEVFRSRIDIWLRWGEEMATTNPLPFESLDEWHELEDSHADDEPDGEPAPPAEEPDADPEEVMLVGMEDAESVIPPRYEWKPLLGRTPQIAVIDLTGMIVMPDMGIPGSRGPVIDPEPLVPTLQEIRDSGHYDGLILHINSPGGSAFASDIIWDALQDVREMIPVVAYCTDVAASGGYYLAVAADHVVCHPTTMTGSIGVVTGKISAPDLAERLGVGVDSVYDHNADTFTSPVHPLSEQMLERMNEDARTFYRRFLQRVGQNRDLSRRRLHRYSRGRVYFGSDAERRDLVDDIGGIDRATEAVAAFGDIDAEDAELDYVPHREQSLRQVLGLQMSAESLVPEELAEPWAASKILERENLLALMPLSVDWRQ